MNILVIGGAGYIGSHVVLELLHRGHSVTVFDNLSTGCRENLFAEAGFIEGDILRTGELQRALERGYDGLIHLAAFKAAGESMEKPEKYSVNNICGTIHIVNGACAAGIRRLVFSSSAAVYGSPQYLPIDEKHPREPENYYGFTKLEIERFLHWYDQLKGLRYAALRYFNAAGYDVDGRVRGLERSPANLLPVIMEVASGRRDKLQVFGTDYPTNDGSGVRDYIHVNDLAAAHAAALHYIDKKDTSITVNLGSDTGISVLEILETARRITGEPIPAELTGRRAGDPSKLVASSKLASELLGWKASYSDIDTLVRTSWNVYQ